MKPIKEKVLKEIKELKGKMKIEEKRDIYSGELVRMYGKLKILEAKLESIEETLVEIGKIIDEMKKKKHIIKINPKRFSTEEQRRVVELLMVKVSKDYEEDLEEIKQRIGIK